MRGRLDTAVVHLPVDAPGLELRTLYTDAFGVYVGGRGRQMEKTLTAADLERMPFGGLTHCEPTEQALAALRSAGVTLNVVVRTSSLGALCGLVAQGAVAALLPQSVATTDMHARAVEAPLPTRTVAVVWRPDVRARRRLSSC